MSGPEKDSRIQAVIYALGRPEHAEATAASIVGEYPGAVITLISDDNAPLPSWAVNKVPSNGALRTVKDTPASKPDLFVLYISNEPAYLRLLDILRACLTMLAFRPAESRVLLYSWSGVHSLKDKASDVVSRAIGIAVRPFYLGGLRLVHAAVEAFRRKRAFDSGSVQKALVISLDLVGDLVWAAPAITSLKKGLPGARLDLLVHPSNARLARMIEGVDTVIEYEAPWLYSIHHPHGGHARPSRLKNLVKRISLALAGYDLTVELRGEPRDHVLAYLTGAPYRAGYVNAKSAGAIRPGDTSYMLTHIVDSVSHEGNGPHMLERNLLVTSSLGIPADRPKRWLIPGPETVEHINKLISETGLGGEGPLVGIQPGASRAEKRWSPDGFSAVARALMEVHGTRVALLGSRAERELCEYITSNAPGAINICGSTDLAEFAAMVSACDLLICNETSAISLASSACTPVVCLMTGVPSLYGPYGVDSAVLQKKPDCYNPVGEHCFCAHGYRCLTEITPDEVTEAAVSLLNTIR